MRNLLPRGPPPAQPQPTCYPPSPCHSLGAQGCWPSRGRAIGHRRRLEGLGTARGEGHIKVRASATGHQQPREAALRSPLALGEPRGLWALLPLCGPGVLAGPGGWDRGSRVSGCTAGVGGHVGISRVISPDTLLTPQPLRACRKCMARTVRPVRDAGSHHRQEELKVGSTYCLPPSWKPFCPWG